MTSGPASTRVRKSYTQAVELAFTAALVLFSAFFIWQATLVREPPRNVVVGPRTFPLIIGGLMLAVSGLLLWRRFQAANAPKSAESEPVVPLEEDETSISDWTAVWLVVGALAALFVLIEPLGFVPSMTLFLFGLSTWFSPGRWLMNLIVAILFSVLFYLVFTQVLDVTLPQGLMFARLNNLLA